MIRNVKASEQPETPQADELDHPNPITRNPGLTRMHPTVKRRILTIGVLLVAGGTAVLAVPSLHTAAGQASSISPAWLFGAVGLELASCLSFVVIFRRFFGELPTAEARRLAWIEMGSGALLPGGGIGSLAAGGVLLRRRGMSTEQIVRRSSGLFFLTSATNVLAMAGAAGLLALGTGGGPDGLTLTLIPGGLGLLAAVVVVAVPRSRWSRSGRGRVLSSVLEGITAAERELLRPSWRLLGALGYLAFDIAVLGLICAGLGHPVGVPALVLAYIIGYAANSLPVPGGIGVLEGGLVGALVLYGAPILPATAAVLLYHTIAFWIPSLGGALAYLLTALRQRADRRAAPSMPRPCEGRTHRPAVPAPVRLERAGSPTEDRGWNKPTQLLPALADP